MNKVVEKETKRVGTGVKFNKNQVLSLFRALGFHQIKR